MTIEDMALAPEGAEVAFSGAGPTRLVICLRVSRPSSGSSSISVLAAVEPTNYANEVFEREQNTKTAPTTRPAAAKKASAKRPAKRAAKP
ncbi:hypothetical protein LJR175_006851 [Variovorax sp. LjRoot175]